MRIGWMRFRFVRRGGALMCVRRFQKVFSGPAGDGGAGAQGFDAAALSAAADWAVVVDGDVTTFGGAACAAVIDLAIENDAGSDAGAQRGVENVAIADACAPDGFGQGGGVAVVIHARGEAENAMDFSG